MDSRDVYEALRLRQRAIVQKRANMEDMSGLEENVPGDARTRSLDSCDVIDYEQ